MEVKIFYCHICKDQQPRFRNSFRKHLSNHLRNNFFNYHTKGNEKIGDKPREEIIKKSWSNNG